MKSNGFLECDTLRFGTYSPTFQRTLLLTSVEQKSSAETLVPVSHMEWCHIQEDILFIFIAVRTLNLTTTNQSFSESQFHHSCFDSEKQHTEIVLYYLSKMA